MHILSREFDKNNSERPSREASNEWLAHFVGETRLQEFVIKSGSNQIVGTPSSPANLELFSSVRFRCAYTTTEVAVLHVRIYSQDNQGNLNEEVRSMVYH